MRDKLQKILALLNIRKSVKDLTDDEQMKVAAKYREKFNSDLLQDLETERKNLTDAEKYRAMFSSLDEETADPETAIEILTRENKEKDEKIRKLSRAIEPDNPQELTVSMEVFTRHHSSTHLFGIQDDTFSLNKRWNALMVNPNLKPLSAVEDKNVFDAFKVDCQAYGAGLAKRYQFLQSIGKLPKKGSAFTQTYTDLANAGLGNQFVVMRQDALIARILELDNVYDLFPRRYGIQDREVMTNAFFGDVSQAYQSGAVYKGTLDLKPEVAHVDDAMFKTLFEGMKWLERQYIGYLNQEGSDPLKWSLIEWTLLQIATKLTMEQYERRILGIFVKPIATKAGHFMHASTGLIYTVLRYVHENKLQAFTDSGLETYDNTGTNMVDWVIAMYEKFKDVAPSFQEKQFALYLNANHRFWYKSQVRAKYGLQQDFTGPIDTLVPDTQMQILWVPNMKQLKFGMIAKPGNFQALEYLPGEMFNVQFQPDMEAFKAWSTWKEGFSATFVGKAFDTPANLLVNAYALQEVFINKPATELAVDATSVLAAQTALNFWFKSAANTGETVLTDFAGAVEGVAYVIECGSTTNATKTAKSGKFSNIDAWEPVVVGDYLMVSYDTENSKFIELERCVNSVRTINELKQPNIPGTRNS